MPLPWKNPERVAALEAALARRILVIDGAMGTMIQRHELQEADYRGERFAQGYDALFAGDGHAHGPGCGCEVHGEHVHTAKQPVDAPGQPDTSKLPEHAVDHSSDRLRCCCGGKTGR